MLRVFKEIKEKNLEAKRIIKEATMEAEKIRKEAEQKSAVIYKTTYDSIMEKAEKDAIALRRKAEKTIAQELEKIKSRSVTAAKEIEQNALENFDKAVDCALNLVLGVD